MSCGACEIVVRFLGVCVCVCVGGCVCGWVCGWVRMYLGLPSLCCVVTGTATMVSLVRVISAFVSVRRRNTI